MSVVTTTAAPGRTSPSRNERLLAWASAWAASAALREAEEFLRRASYACGGCGRPFEDGALIHRVRRVGAGVIALCGGCARSTARAELWVSGGWRQPRACAGACSALVTEPIRYSAAYRTCSPLCADAASRIRRWRVCAYCGGQFAARADARYCLSAHRQAAYRQRRGAT